MGIDPVRTPLLALAALTTATSLASAQTFQAYYSPDTSFGNDIINSRDCGFVAVGVTPGTAGPTGAFLMRLTPEGKVVWSKQYSDQGLLSRGYSVVESSQNDDLIIGGMAGDQTLGIQCQFVLRTDSAGNPIWNAMLNGGFSLQALFNNALIGFLPTGVTEMHKGQIASVGHLSGVNGVARVGMLSLLDADGSLLFSNRYVPAGGSTIALDFIQARETRDPDPSNEILVLGTMTIATNVFAMFAMRTDIDGNIIWARTYRHNDGVTSLAGHGFDLASNGDILFSATRALVPVSPGTNPNAVVGRIDALTGDPVWAVYVDDFGPGYQAVTRARRRTACRGRRRSLAQHHPRRPAHRRRRPQPAVVALRQRRAQRPSHRRGDCARRPVGRLRDLWSNERVLTYRYRVPGPHEQRHAQPLQRGRTPRQRRHGRARLPLRRAPDRRRHPLSPRSADGR